MNNIRLYAVCDDNARFLHYIMNIDAVLGALNEVPTQLCDWTDAIKEWNHDDDEEDYIIKDGETPIGWLGINGLSSEDKIAYLKMAVILPDYQNKGIGHYSINQVIEMLKNRNYSKIILYTDQENHKAQSCYRKCGFEVTEILTEEMSNGKIVPRCKMELALKK